MEWAGKKGGGNQKVRCLKLNYGGSSVREMWPPKQLIQGSAALIAAYHLEQGRWMSHLILPVSDHPEYHIQFRTRYVEGHKLPKAPLENNNHDSAGRQWLSLVERRPRDCSVKIRGATLPPEIDLCETKIHVDKSFQGHEKRFSISNNRTFSSKISSDGAYTFRLSPALLVTGQSLCRGKISRSGLRRPGSIVYSALPHCNLR